jgi:hypothetical protein
MKRLLVGCCAALALLASADKASAWTRNNFNVGMNISSEGAENNTLWGAFRNGPHPCAQGGCCPGFNYPNPGGCYNGAYGMAGYGNRSPIQYSAPVPISATPTLPPVPTPAGPSLAGAPQAAQQVGYYYTNPYYAYPYYSNSYYSYPYYSVPPYAYGR